MLELKCMWVLNRIFVCSIYCGHFKSHILLTGPVSKPQVPQEWDATLMMPYWTYHSLFGKHHTCARSSWFPLSFLCPSKNDCRPFQESCRDRSVRLLKWMYNFLKSIGIVWWILTLCLNQFIGVCVCVHSCTPIKTSIYQLLMNGTTLTLFPSLQWSWCRVSKGVHRGVHSMTAFLCQTFCNKVARRPPWNFPCISDENFFSLDQLVSRDILFLLQNRNISSYSLPWLYSM